MEIYNKKENPNLNPETKQSTNQSTETDLHEEGVDIVAGSSVREEGEFDGGKLVEVRAETPIQTSTPVSTPTPIPNTPEPTKPPVDVKNDPSIKSIRTFKTDAEEAVKYKNISTVDIAVAEQKKRESTPIQYEKENGPRFGLVVLTAVVLVIILGGGWFYWFKTSQPEKTPTITASVKTIIPYVKGSTVVLRDGSNPIEIIAAKLKSSNAALGEIYATVPTLNAISTEYAPISLILSQTEIPGKLERSLAPDYMIGAYMYDSNSPFIILTDTFFQNTFAGMLEWEKNMRNDLLPIIQVSYPEELVSATTSNVFEDTVVLNTDARVLKNTEGKIILIYAFADTKTVIIATSENTLSYLLDRLLAVRSVQ